MRVLILSATTGGGHMAAAEAVKGHIEKCEPTSHAEIVDTLEYINPILNKTITEGYVYLATKTPKIFGVLYKKSNKDTPLKSLVGALNNLFSRKINHLLNDFSPDIIVTTHPFPAEMVSNLRRLGKISIPILCIMTDYAPHKTWINEHIDAYVVSSNEMVEHMVQMGAPHDKVHPFGIPVDDSFFKIKNRKETLREFGLCGNLPIILIMAGSFGVTHIVEIYKKLLEIDLSFQVIIITGKNKKLFNLFEKRLKNPSASSKTIEALKKLPMSQPFFKNENTPPPKGTKLIFFTQEVHKYMQVADLIITKPGGLTVSEALACNLPMAIFDAIPGPEEENANFLVKNNMAIRLESAKSCQDAIFDLLKDQEKLAEMKNSCEKFDKSKSNSKIFTLMKNLCDKNN